MNTLLKFTNKAGRRGRIPEAGRRAWYMAIMIVLIVGAFTALLLPASASSSASVGGYTLSFVGPVVYNDDGTSTWNYSLKWDGNDPMLSHFIIEVGTCAKIVGYSTSGAEKVEIGHDNKTDITGIKWEFNDFPANDGVAFSFTLDGHYSAGQVGFGAKAGGNANVGAITGPSLSCDVVIDEPDDGGEDGDDNDGEEPGDDDQDGDDGNEEDSDDECDDGEDEDTTDDTTDDTTPPTNGDDEGEDDDTTDSTNPPATYYYPPTPSSRVLSDVVTAPTTTVVETETPAPVVEKEIAVTETTPAREELPYTGMNGLSALLAMALMAGGTFIFRGSNI